MRLTTERLILRPPVAGDIDAIFEGMSDWEVVKTLARPPWPYERQDAARWLAMQDDLRADGQKTALMLALKTAPERAIGCAGLEAREDGQVHLGFWLARSCWGLGLMTEACAELLRYGFEDLGLARIHSGCFRDNEASRRVHQKLGFAVTGESRILCVPRGESVDHIDLALTRADWAAANGAAGIGLAHAGETR